MIADLYALCLHNIFQHNETYVVFYESSPQPIDIYCHYFVKKTKLQVLNRLYLGYYLKRKDSSSSAYIYSDPGDKSFVSNK